MSADESELQLHIPADLEYHYRDLFNVHVGSGEVILEFGNRHRSPPDRGTLSNRLVISVENAYKLNQTLGLALEDARRRLTGEK